MKDHRTVSPLDEGDDAALAGADLEGTRKVRGAGRLSKTVNSALCLLLLGLVGPSLASTKPSAIVRAPTQYSQRLISSDDGLVNDNIQAILEARDGRLWIGTLGGLYIYDGANLIAVRDQPGPEGALPEARINALAQDAGGGIWAGTANGLALFQAGRWQVFGKSQGVPDPDIGAVQISASGHVWVASGSRGLIVRDPGAARFRPVPGTQGQRIQALINDGRTDRVLAGLGTGELLSVGPDGVRRKWAAEAGLPAAAVTALVIVPGGDLLIGTQGGLFRLSRSGRAVPVPLGPAPQSAWVRSLALDDGAVWVGLNAGLGRLTPTGLALVDRAGATFGEPVKLLRRDREGSLWAGTTAGILVLTRRAAFTLDVADGLPVNAGGLICRDREGAIWSANDSRGLSVRPRGDRDRFERIEGLPGTQLFGLACGRNGPWVAINGIGVGQWSGGRFRLAGGWARAASATVITMIEDSKGRVWVGTFADGLARRERDGRWTLFRDTKDLPRGGITALFEARDGSIWIGGQGGASIWRDGQPAELLDETAIPGALVMSFAQDRDGDIWIGSRRGVSRYSASQLSSLSGGTAPFAAGFAVQPDPSGAIWVAGELGIARFSKTDFVAAASTAGRALPFRPVGKSDGIEGTPVWASPGSLIDTTGRLWFATTRGLAVIDQAALDARKPAPRARLLRIAVGGIDQGTGREVQLRSDRPRLDIRFAATALSDASVLRYRYRLDGFDDGWVSTEIAEAAYTNLPPGEYRFDVATRIGDGPETITRGLAIIVQMPPLYARPWFVALCLSLFAGLAVLAYRIRMATVRDRHAAILDERTRIARDMHDTLLQSLAGLAMQVQAAARKAARSGEESHRQLAKIAAEARRSLSEARDAVWDMRAEPEAREGGFAAMLERFVDQHTREAGVTSHLDLSGSWDEHPSAVLDALGRVVQEAVRNAILHGGASEITVAGHSSAKGIRLSIEDNGKGFAVDASRSALGGHWGLLGMRERAERIGGTLALESQPGKGTRICVEVPA
jgi:signal transduction histidine kinase/ligand-binding sensor domain-containing protein